MDCLRDGFEQGKLLGGRFVTVSPLNHGSFGMVFAARDITTGADVAIKCITKPGGARDHCPAAIAIDDRSEELDIHSRLNHPNIVNLVNHFETENHQYMVLELCSNGDLYEAIRVGHGPLETGHVRDFMLQLVDAIDYLHSNGVYHRDIKPENIFLTKDGLMKLGDFGLATTDTWSTEFAVGSDRYMAPEQFDASVYGYGYSPASADIWAIGVVLLNVLFQRNPFATPTLKDPLFSDFVHDRQSLFDVFPNMSQDTYNVLAHSLALDPANRSLGAVREAIKAVVSFTTDDESIDDFCNTEEPDIISAVAAEREPLRTPSLTSLSMGGEAFPWASALLKTPQKNTRQLSTIQDDEGDIFPGSVKSEWHYVDTDEASLSSNLDSGLGMSYKSTKSSASRPLSTFVGSLPISFSRPTSKYTPYGSNGNGFSKSWSDLWDEDEEVDTQEQRTSFDSGLDIERVSTAKPSATPLHVINEEGRGSVTPRQGLIEVDANMRAATTSPLRKLIEDDKKFDETQSPKQRSSSILDKWSALGNFRRAKGEATVSAPIAAPTPQKSKVADAFANFTPFGNSKKVKVLPPSLPRDRAGSWRQGSPSRLRSVSTNNTTPHLYMPERACKERDQSPANPNLWTKDTNWRQHKSPVSMKPRSMPSPPLLAGLGLHNISTPQQNNPQQKSFLDYNDFEDDIGDLEWVGGWGDELRDLHL
ncbi:hypothetical protein LTR08_009186 [Meristemomyces frigidus]|nr:hypothetical protein LTR08_009186 [Meristemomyces frigidus]